METNTDTKIFKRRIRSFVKREGRFTRAQQRAFDLYWDKFGVEYTSDQLILSDLFERDAPTILEIGFGNGESLATMAENNPDKNYFGIEVHRPGVGQLLQSIADKELSSVRASIHDAIEVITHQIPDNSLAGVQIFFPDPWPKTRHHKRRIIQSEFMTLIATKLKPNGFVHLATDWAHYAEHMMEVMQGHQDYENTVAGFIERPDFRPVTKFETRGLKLGHEIFDLMFVKK